MTRAPLSQLDDWKLENKDQDLRGRPLQDAAGNTVGTIAEMIVDTNTEYVEAITLRDGTEISTNDIEIANGAVYLRHPADAPATTETAPIEGDEMRLPVVEEELQVGKRAVQRGGIRVTTHVTEQPVEKQVTVRDETLHVDRRPADRPASEADLNQMQDQTFEVSETDEEVVAGKQARVTEEVQIKKDVEERTETIKDTVRRTDVDIERQRDRKSGR